MESPEWPSDSAPGREWTLVTGEGKTFTWAAQTPQQAAAEAEVARGVVVIGWLTD